MSLRSAYTVLRNLTLRFGKVCEILGLYFRVGLFLSKQHYRDTPGTTKRSGALKKTWVTTIINFYKSTRHYQMVSSST